MITAFILALGCAWLVERAKVEAVPTSALVPMPPPAPRPSTRYGDFWKQILGQLNEGYERLRKESATLTERHKRLKAESEWLINGLRK